MVSHPLSAEQVEEAMLHFAVEGALFVEEGLSITSNREKAVAAYLAHPVGDLLTVLEFESMMAADMTKGEQL